MKEELLIRAVRPWSGPDAGPPRRVHTCDRQAYIDRCLNCERNSCRGTCPPRAGRPRPAVDHDAIRRLKQSGHTNAEIAGILGCDVTTVRRWLRRLAAAPPGASGR